MATWRRYGEKRLGPYWRLVYREGGKRRTVYLGRFGTLVRMVRARLRHLQQYRNLRRYVNRSVRETKASLRTVKEDLARRLRNWGLRLKGWEVRGWRTCTIRWALNLTQPFRCVPLGPQPYFPKITLPNLPEIFGTGLISNATYWGLLRQQMKGQAKKTKKKKPNTWVPPEPDELVDLESLMELKEDAKAESGKPKAEGRDPLNPEP